MDFRININTVDIQKNALDEAEKQARRSALSYVNSYFAEANVHLHRKEGVGTTLIKQMIDEELLSADFEKKIRERVRALIDKAADEAIDLMVGHTARRFAFLERDAAIIARLEQTLQTAPEDKRDQICETIAYFKGKPHV